MRHHLTLAAAAVLAATTAALAGCAGPDPAPESATSAPAPVTAATPTVEQPATRLAPVHPQSLRYWLPKYTQTLMDTQDPTGSAPEVALRFLRDLQSGDYLQAAQQLSAGERLAFALHSRHWLDRVMADVIDHAGLRAAAPCTRASWVNTEAAVVTCGTQQVVVHARSGLVPGVQVSRYFPHDDIYLGAHTHAYTRYDV